MSRLTHPLITAERLLKTAIVYLRVSTPTQVRESEGSIQIQFDQQQIARDYGWSDTLIKVIDDDLGRSGTGTRHRPGWLEMLRLIRTGTVSAVLVWMVSRLSRELRDFEELRELCRIYNVIMIVNGRPADPRDPNDTVLMQIEAMLAQYDNRVRANMMMQARRQKARSGCIVSRLPVGWKQNDDGTFDYDPEVRAAIMGIYHTFWREQSVLATVRALHRADKLIPSQRRRGVGWVRARVKAVRQFLTHVAYTGTYAYGMSEARPDLGYLKSGYPKRQPAPAEKWIQIPNNHPAYISAEEQARIKEILKGNRFDARHRPRNGEGLCQGLLRCARCGTRLDLSYPRGQFRYYRCARNETMYGQKRCFGLSGRPIDAAVEYMVLQALQMPSIERLRDALAQSRAAEQAEAESRDAELSRLRYEEHRARDHFHASDERNKLVFAYAQEHLEKAMARRIACEQRLAAEPAPSPARGTDEELQELCAIAADVPRLWHDPVVSHQERKRILRCLIEKIYVDVTGDTIEATIHWASGARTAFHLWLRGTGVRRLIAEKHAEGWSVPQIRAWLAQKDPRTGQSIPMSKTHIYRVLNKLNLTPHPHVRTRKQVIVG